MRGHDLTRGSITRTLALFTLPILLSNVLQTINGSINAIWVGHYLGEAELAATSIANTLTFLLLSLIFGIGMAVTILVGQAIGAKRMDEARQVIGTGASLFFSAAWLISALGWLFAPEILQLMKAAPEVMAPALTYLRISFLGLPFLLLYVFVTMVLRGSGDSRTPLLFLILSVALDIVLNPILIFGWGPLPRLGIAGSAWASVLAGVTALLALLAYLRRQRHVLWLGRSDWHHLKPRADWVKALLRKGIPMGLQMIILSGSAMMMMGLVNRQGVHTTAAFGAAMQLWNYIQMPALAVGMAVSSMVAQNVGAGSWGRVGRIALTGLAYGLALTTTLVLCVYFFSRHSLGLFLPADSPAMPIAQHINGIAVWAFLFFCVAMTLTGVVRATGAVMAPLLILFFSMWLVRLPVAGFMAGYWPDALWWSYPLSSLLAMVLTVVYYRLGGWRKARMRPAA